MRKVFVVILILVVASVGFLSQAARFLVKKDPLIKADAALVFSGDPDYERTIEASRLYREGRVRKLILTGHGYGGDDARYMKKIALGEGVLSRDIIIENGSTSTFTNIVQTKDIVLSQGFTTVALVSSPYHMRRIRVLVSAVYKDNNEIGFICFPVRESYWSPKGWWKTNFGRRLVFFEYIKLLSYWLFGILDQDEEGRILWKYHDKKW